MEKKKIVYFEYLRVFSALFVIAVHLAASGFDQTGFTSTDLAFCCFVKGFRWPIGIFFMISGALFLKKDIDIRTLYTRYLARILVAYLSWRVIYSVYYYCVTGDFFSSIITEPFHFWYLPVLMGIYVCTPIFKLIVGNEKVMKYYLIVSYIVGFCVPQATILIRDFVPAGTVQDVLNAVNNIFVGAQIYAVCGWGFFYVLGYYVSNMDIKKKQEIIIYILGVIGLFVTGILAWYTGDNDNFSFFLVLSSTPVFAIFVFFKKHVTGWKWLDKYVFALGRLSFGIYLVHVLVLGIEAECFNLYVGRVTPFISIPGLTFITFSASALITWGISKIPVLNKYLV